MADNLRSLSTGYKTGSKKKLISTPRKHATSYSFCAATQGEIASTLEYESFMDKNLSWQQLNSNAKLTAKFKREGFSGFLFDSVGAELACRLMLRAMDDGTPINWTKEAPRYVLRAIAQDMVADMALDHVHNKSRMTWAPSGAFNWNDFISHIMSTDPDKPKDMPLTATTLLNCWEFVMAMGINANRYSWEDLREGYRLNNTELLKSLKGGREYTCWDETYGFWDTHPLKGDMVFFDGLSHVALATGYEDEVVSFWILPEANANPSAVMPHGKANVALTSVTRILDACKKYATSIKAVTFTTAPWNVSWPS